MFTHAILQRDRSGGLSLVEVLITVSVLGILAALGVGLVASGIIGGSQEAKLEQDQRTLNTAVAAYLHSGGDLSTVSDAEEVILRLKARVSEEQRSISPGLFGPFLDSAATLRIQDSRAAMRGDARLVWDADSKRFLMTSSGPPGIAGLVLDFATPSPAGSDTGGQRNQVFEYASEGSWIWDYEDVPIPEPLGPSFVPVSEAPENSILGSGSSGSGPQPPIRPELGTLLAPEFSVPSGTYSIVSYPLSVLLSDPNPEGTASIYFRIDYASWQSFNGDSISIQPNQALQAQAIPLDPAAYEASVLVEEFYETNPVALAPPVIELSALQFSLDAPTVTVEITHDADPENFRIDYRIDGGAWTLYASPFFLNRLDHPEGAVIEAVAVATVSYYLDSSVASASVGTAPPEPVTSLLDADFDTSIAATVPDWSGVSGQLYCNGLDPAQTLLYFDTVDKIAGPATVKSAALYLTRTAGSDGVFYAHGILSGTGDWWVSGITWNTAGDGLQTDGAELDTDAQDSATPVAEIPGVPGWSYRNKWDITDLVQRWIDDPSSNYGVAILAAPEQRIIYCSREHPGENVRPKLVIEWAPR